jgi:hypothetical protein
LNAAKKDRVWIIREPGSSGRANTIRVNFGTKAYPDGSAAVYDQYGHPLDYKTGKVPNTKGDWHIPAGNQEPVKGLPGWYTGDD